MANKFLIKNGLLVDGRVDVTGSINLSQGISAAGGFTGSLAGTASYATYALNATVNTSSFVVNSQTSSFVTNSQTSSFVTNSQTSSFARTDVQNTFSAAQVFNGNVTINATASISYLNVVYQTASVIYSSGSNQIGDDTSDVQLIVGTTKVSGSLQVTGSMFGNLTGTASWATNATTATSATSATNATNTTNVNVTDNIGGAGPLYITFVSSTSGNQAINVDSSTLTYDPSVNTITATASYASQAGNSTNLNGQAASYYTNASNINAGKIANAYLPSAINVTSVTASFAGSLTGTASYASQALTASFASSAPISGITGLGSNVATFLQTPSSANLASAVTDETGTGALVFANTPTLTTPNIGAATGTSLQVTGMVSGSVVARGGHSKTYSDAVSCSATSTTNILALDYNTTPYIGVFVKYAIYDATYTNMRAGTLMIITDLANNGTAANIAESTTQDIGNTIDADFTVTAAGTTLNIALDLSASSTSYTAVFDYTLIR
jgi:hypothetical protein